jgi:hypothetical protein
MKGLYNLYQGTENCGIVTYLTYLKGKICAIKAVSYPAVLSNPDIAPRLLSAHEKSLNRNVLNRCWYNIT